VVGTGGSGRCLEVYCPFHGGQGLSVKIHLLPEVCSLHVLQWTVNSQAPCPTVLLLLAPILGWHLVWGLSLHVGMCVRTVRAGNRVAGVHAESAISATDDALLIKMEHQKN
jgi:hypothetical protein